MRLSALLGPCIALLFPFVSAAQSIKVDPGSLEFNFQQVIDPQDPTTRTQKQDIRVSGVSNFTASVDSRQLTINLSQPWIQVSVRNSVVTVTVTRYSNSAMPDTHDYLANVTITSGGQKRVVPVLVHVFPQPDFRPELPVLNLPDSKGSFTGSVSLLLSDAAGDAALRAGRSLSVTATPDPLNPDASAYSVQQTKPFPTTGPYRAEFAVTANASPLSEGAHSIGVTFSTAQNLTADLLVNVTVTGTPQPSSPTVSGTVRANGQGLAGVTISFANGPTVATNSAGAYSATLPAGYSGSATPSLSGFTFTPSSRPYTQVNSNLGGEDYTAAAVPSGNSVTVSGRVMTSDGQPVAGALVVFSGGYSTGTDTSGRYTATVPSGYSGSATVLLSGLTASPPTYQYTNLTTNQSGADFTVTAGSYNVSGTVRNQQGQPLAGVTISFDNGQYTATDAQGRYSTGLPAGFSGTATPSLSGFTFSPASRSYNNFSSNPSTEDYSAFPASSGKVTVSGTVRSRDGQPLAGVTVSVPGLQPALTGDNGVYSVVLDSGYSGTITLSLAGYTFDPAARTYTGIRQDQSGQDYIAAPSNASTTVSGIVRDQLGNPLAGVLLAFTGGPTVVSGADGTYSAVLPPGYSGSVTPSLAGYRFDPAPRNYSRLPAVLLNEDYAAAFQSSPTAEITSPAPGSALGSGRVTFQWTPGSCPSQYYLAIGSQPGGSDLVNEDPGFVTSYTATSLPTDGRTLYLRLFTKLGSDFQYNDYTFTAANASAPRQAATLLWPAPSGTLSSSAVTFRWTAGSGVTQYYLSLGSKPGVADLINQDAGNALSARVPGLPTDGSPVYVRLLSRIDGDWSFNDYQYKAAGGPQAGRAELLSPPDGSTFCSSSVPFQWSRGVNVSQYYMAIGRAPGGNDVGNIDLGTASSRTVDNLPADGRPLYVRLLSLIGTQWFYNDYVFGAARR